MKSSYIFCLLVFLMCSCEQSSPTDSTDNSASSGQNYVGSTAGQITAPTSRGADISLEVEERDFGIIWDFQTVTTTFPFTNTGSKTLVLSRLQAGCGCTTPIADKTVLQPGESGTITVTFDPKGKSKKQDKKVTIFSNSVHNPEKAFWIRSYVSQFVDVKNKFLKLNQMTLGKPHFVEFDFFPVDPNFKITSMVGTGKHAQYIQGEELVVPSGSPRRIRISVSPDMPWGSFHSQLKVTGTGTLPNSDQITHTFTVFANGLTYGKIEADNHIISLGTLQPGSSYYKQVRIFRPDGEAFRVLNSAVLQATVSGINGTATQNLDSSYNIIISGTLPNTHQGPFNAELMVQTDVSGEEVLKFRIAGVVPKK